MEKVRDIVIVGQYRNEQQPTVLYGATKSGFVTCLDASRVKHNGLLLFESVAEALPTMHEVIIKGKDLESAHYAQMELERMALDLKGKPRGPFIIVVRTKVETQLLGHKVDGVDHVISSCLSDFERNRLRPLRNYQRAAEATRHLRSYAQDASLMRLSLRQIG